MSKDRQYPIAGRQQTMENQEVVHIDMGTVSGVPGQWVLVVENKVVASSDDAYEICLLAEKYPEEDAYITKILFPGASFF